MHKILTTVCEVALLFSIFYLTNQKKKKKKWSLFSTWEAQERRSPWGWGQPGLHKWIQGQLELHSKSPPKKMNTNKQTKNRKQSMKRLINLLLVAQCVANQDLDAIPQATHASKGASHCEAFRKGWAPVGMDSISKITHNCSCSINQKLLTNLDWW